jgi:hypothetical protein
MESISGLHKSMHSHKIHGIGHLKFMHFTGKNFRSNSVEGLQV